MMKRVTVMAVAAVWTMGVILEAQAQQEHSHDMHMQHQSVAAAPAAVDKRTLVSFPEPLHANTLANMRDHLLALAEIQEAMSRNELDKAGAIAEQRLGMSSLKLHGAHEVGTHMPPAMAAIGSEMHRAASRFAVAANDAAVSGEFRVALSALSQVTRQCIACHNGYRLQ